MKGMNLVLTPVLSYHELGVLGETHELARKCVSL